MSFDLLEFAERCGVPEPARFVARTEELRQLLEEANRTTNLTRIIEPEDFMVKHVADSLSIALFFPELTRDKLLLADIGCGAGFPSLVLALAFPNLRLSAIDSAGKKVRFVESAAAALGLHNVRAIHGRSRELNFQSDYKHHFDVVTARAVSTAWTVIQDARDFPNRNGRFILYKTPDQLATDLVEVRKMDAKSNRKWLTTEPFLLTEAAGMRQFLFSAK